MPADRAAQVLGVDMQAERGCLDRRMAEPALERAHVNARAQQHGREGVWECVERDALAQACYSLLEAQVLVARWRKHCNTVRPHSSRGYRPPAPEATRPWTPDLPALGLPATVA